MKKKALIVVAVVVALVTLTVAFLTPSLTEKPEEAREIEMCFVGWRDPGVLNVNVFYTDGTYAGGALDVDEARQKFADDETVLARIEEVAATERNVVWWVDNDHLMVGVGDTSEVLTVDDALDKYQDNPVIVAKIQYLNGIQVEYIYDSFSGGSIE